MKIRRLAPIGILIVLASLVTGGNGAVADSDWISEAGRDVQVNFPDDVVFTIQFTSTRPIGEVVLSLRVVGRESTRREPATIEEGDTTTATFVLKTRGGSSLYIPPGAEITYSWTFEDSEGNTIRSEPETFLYMDTRFDWEVLTDGFVSAYYYGPIETRARTILETAVMTLDSMGAVLETELTRPVKLIIYNNPVQMQEALPFVSRSTTSGLVTQGQAHAEEGVLLIMAFDSLIRGITSHEVTHLLIAQAAEGPGRRVPAWLNEGLAEYGNIEPGFSYDQALLFAIRENRLLPITHMTGRPGTPEDTIVFYGQSRNIVKFMIDNYGQKKMAELLRVFKDGEGDIDDALLEVYGFDRVELDNRWRASIGLPALPETEVPDTRQASPTPRPTRVPLGAHTPTPAIVPTPEPVEPPAVVTAELSADLEGLAIMQGAYGTRTGDPAYAAAADLNGDQAINYLDLAILGARFKGSE